MMKASARLVPNHLLIMYQAHLHQKVLEYLDHEVALVWVVDPKTRTATVYRSRQDVSILGESDDIDGREVLPGFSCRVAEFFQ